MPIRLLSAPPIVIGRSRPSWRSMMLPYALGALVAVGLCSFLFVSGPRPPEVSLPSQAAVVQQPGLSGGAVELTPPAVAPEHAIDASQAVVAPQSAEPLTQREVFEIQLRLQEEQLDPGPVDGVAGPRTVTAIRRYQARKGLARTGQLDRELLESLRNEQTAAR